MSNQQSRNRRRAHKSEHKKECLSNNQRTRVHYHLVSRDCLKKIETLDAWTVRPNEPCLMEFLTAAETTDKMERKYLSPCHPRYIYRYGDCPVRVCLRKLWPKILTYCPYGTLRWLIERSTKSEEKCLMERFEDAMAHSGFIDVDTRRRMEVLSRRRDLDHFKPDDFHLLSFCLPPANADGRFWVGSYAHARLATRLFAEASEPLVWPLSVIRNRLDQLNGLTREADEFHLCVIGYHVHSAMDLVPNAIEEILIPKMILDPKILYCDARNWVCELLSSYRHDDNDTRIGLLFTCRLILSTSSRQHTEFPLTNQVLYSPSMVTDLVIYSFETGFHTEWLTKLANPDILHYRIKTIRHSETWNKVRLMIRTHTNLLPPLVEIAIEFAWPSTLELFGTTSSVTPPSEDLFS